MDISRLFNMHFLGFQVILNILLKITFILLIWMALSIGFSVTLVVFFCVLLCQVLALIFALYLVFNQQERIRVVYVTSEQNGVSMTEPSLTRETLKRHDLPYQLRKERQRKYY
uniref:E3 ubiquitin-protein ligase n=1 Tax=Heterorhabditis bacteriophora TaxID=37862 RepID=A0A1I7WJR6_HETBA